MSKIKINTIENVAGTSSVSVDNVTGLNTHFSHRNKLINGGFDVWQRGTDFTTTFPAYTADRMLGNDSRIRKSNIGNLHAMWVSDVSNAWAYIGYQRVEDGKRLLEGKTVTLSFVWEAIANCSEAYLHVQNENGASVDYFFDAPTVSGNKTITFVAPTDGITGDYLIIGLHVNRETVQGEAKVANMQLEEGSVATPFEQRPIGYELSLCQRYYEEAESSFRQFSTSASQVGTILFRYKVTKRVVPSVTIVEDVKAIWSNNSNDKSNITGFDRQLISSDSSNSGYYYASILADAEL